MRRSTALILFVASVVLAGIGPQSPGVQARGQDQPQAAIVGPALFGATAGGDQLAPSNFYSIDPSTGNATLIGPIGFSAVSAMDFHPFTGVLYATGRSIVSRRWVLLTINSATGVGIEVGPLGGVAGVQDMSFRNSDAKLFAYSEGFLITINTATGAASTIGRIDSFGGAGNAVAFSPTDGLFHSNDDALSIINQTTGAQTLLTHLHYPPGFIPAKFGAMDFKPGTSTLYGCLIPGFFAYLATIDTLTGDVTVIGRMVGRLDAIAWMPSTVGNFDLCLQDETYANMLLFNSQTGAYQFTDCHGTIITGTGGISRRGCLITLTANGPERRILARIDTCLSMGTAYLQIFSPGRSFSILDRNLTNNTCTCPGTTQS